MEFDPATSYPLGSRRPDLVETPSGAPFESLTRDVIAEYGGRVVKTIGDEVMFLCANPIAGADLALRLVEAHTEDDILPPVKVGLDCGPILLRDGDAFGPTVNRASRLVATRSTARPAFVCDRSACAG